MATVPACSLSFGLFCSCVVLATYLMDTLVALIVEDNSVAGATIY